VPRPSKNNSFKRDFSAAAYDDFIAQRYERKADVIRRSQPSVSYADRVEKTHSKLQLGTHIKNFSNYANGTVNAFTSIWGLIKLAFVLFALYKVYRLIKPSFNAAQFGSALASTSKPPVGDDIWWDQKASDFYALNQEGALSAWLTQDEITTWCSDVLTYADYLKIVLSYGARNTGAFQTYGSLNLPQTVSKYATADAQIYFNNWLRALKTAN
jgi:hypothetical protein